MCEKPCTVGLPEQLYTLPITRSGHGPYELTKKDYLGGFVYIRQSCWNRGFHIIPKETDRMLKSRL